VTLDVLGGKNVSNWHQGKEQALFWVHFVLPILETHCSRDRELQEGSVVEHRNAW